MQNCEEEGYSKYFTNQNLESVANIYTQPLLPKYPYLKFMQLTAFSCLKQCNLFLISYCVDLSYILLITYTEVCSSDKKKIYYKVLCTIKKCFVQEYTVFFPSFSLDCCFQTQMGLFYFLKG